METTEICRLSESAVAKLLADRVCHLPDTSAKRRRRVVRWPFPGTVELWIPVDDGRQRYTLATSLDLSLRGVGVRSEEPLRVGMKLAVAIHEPEGSFHGHAVVRHCTQIEDDYLIGLEFLYDEV